MVKTDAKIVVLGGGTGSFMLLSALKKYTKHLTAIVSMADDGGSTGVLRDELGVLPPGDVRQCLVALSRYPKLRDLFNYRFEEGTFGGHSFGNIFLTALEKTTGGFGEAVETASKVLNIQGKVLPATLDNVRLKMVWHDKSVTLHGERVIDAGNFDHDPREATLQLEPVAKANLLALEAITEADIILLAPGDLYTSLGPLLAIEGISQALEQANGVVVYACNLVTKKGQTDNFSVIDHASEIERFADRQILDYVVYNSQKPSRELAKRYEDEDAYIVKAGDAIDTQHYKVLSGDFLGEITEKDAATDLLPVVHSYIRHDGEKLAATLLQLGQKK